MHKCAQVCTSVYMHECACASVYRCARVCIRMCAHVSTDKCAQVCIGVHKCACTIIITYVRKCLRLYVCKCACTSMHKYIRTYAQMYTDTAREQHHASAPEPRIQKPESRIQNLVQCAVAISCQKNFVHSAIAISYTTQDSDGAPPCD